MKHCIVGSNGSFCLTAGTMSFSGEGRSTGGQTRETISGGLTIHRLSFQPRLQRPINASSILTGALTLTVWRCWSTASRTPEHVGAPAWAIPLSLRLALPSQTPGSRLHWVRRGPFSGKDPAVAGCGGPHRTNDCFEPGRLNPSIGRVAHDCCPCKGQMCWR